MLVLSTVLKYEENDATSPIRAYLAPLCFAQIPHLWPGTSDTLGILAEITDEDD